MHLHLRTPPWATAVPRDISRSGHTETYDESLPLLSLRFVPGEPFPLWNDFIVLSANHASRSQDSQEFHVSWNRLVGVEEDFIYLLFFFLLGTIFFFFCKPGGREKLSEEIEIVINRFAFADLKFAWNWPSGYLIIDISLIFER